MNAPLPAILLGGELTALAVARSLSGAGIDVSALGRPGTPLRHSRCHRGFTELGPWPQSEAESLRWLEQGPGEGIVLPCNDEGLELVAHNRDRLAELGYATIEADDEVLLSMLDKERAYKLARAAGVDAPRTVPVDSLDAARHAAAEVGYPCALKPRHSHRFARHFEGKAFVVMDEAQLSDRVTETLEREVEMIVTEIIPGPDRGHVSYYGYLDEAGESLIHITKRKLRQQPNRFGVGCFHATEWMPEVAELGLRFFQQAGVRGLACVEFKHDERDGRLKLIECNHRFTLATELLRAAGADLPLLAYNRVAGRPAPVIDSYRTGIGLWYPLRDARAFREYRRNGELGFRQWVRSLLRPMRLPAASFRDPGPSLAEAWRKLTRMLGVRNGR